MLLSLSQWLLSLYPEWGFLRLFNYITFRAVMAAMTALLIGLAFGPWVIRRLTEMKIGQLSNALLRNCRYLSAIGLHARGMTVAQSEQLFKTECYQDAGNSKQQAARGTYDPAYLNYTMGKLMIRKLRDDWTKGDRKKWKAFHDEFLSYGGPPIPMVRQAMLKEKEAKAVF